MTQTKKATNRKDVLEFLKYIRTAKRMLRIFMNTDMEKDDKRIIEAAGDDFVTTYLEQKELIIE